ncbi:hypothetical protein BC936DRAFT_148076, partial [Jimgerdemannia flammicorona]
DLEKELVLSPTHTIPQFNPNSESAGRLIAVLLSSIQHKFQNIGLATEVDLPTFPVSTILSQNRDAEHTGNRGTNTGLDLVAAALKGVNDCTENLLSAYGQVTKEKEALAEQVQTLQREAAGIGENHVTRDVNDMVLEHDNDGHERDEAPSHLMPSNVMDILLNRLDTLESRLLNSQHLHVKPRAYVRALDDDSASMQRDDATSHHIESNNIEDQDFTFAAVAHQRALNNLSDHIEGVGNCFAQVAERGRNLTVEQAKSLRRLRAEKDQLNADLQNAKRVADEWCSNVRGLETQLQEQKDVMSAQIAKVTEERIRFLKEYDSLKQTATEKDDLISELRATIQDYSRIISEKEEDACEKARESSQLRMSFDMTVEDLNWRIEQQAAKHDSDAQNIKIAHEDHIAAKELTIQVLRDRIAEISDERNSLENRVREKDDTVVWMQEQLEDAKEWAKSEREVHERELCGIQNEVRMLMENNAKVVKERDVARTEVEKVREAHQKEAKDWKEISDSLQNKLNDAKKDADMIRGRHEEVVDTYEEQLYRVAADSRQTIDGLQGELETERGKLERLNLELRDSRDQIERGVMEAEEIRHQVETSAQAIRQREEEIVALEARRDELSDQLNNTRAEHAEKIAQNEHAYSELSEQLAWAQLEKVEVGARRVELEEELTAVKHGNLISTLQHERMVEDMLRKMETLETELDARDSLIAEKNAAIEKAEHGLMAAWDAMEKEMNDKDKRIKNLEDQQGLLRDTLDSLSTQLASMTDQRAVVEDRLQRTKSLVDSHAETIQMLMASEAKASAELEYFKRDKDDERALWEENAKREMRDVVERYEKLGEESKDTQRCLRESLKGVSREKQDLLEQYRELKQSMESIVQDKEKALQDVRSLEEVHSRMTAELNAEISRETERLRMANCEGSNLRDKISELERDKVETTNEIARLQMDMVEIEERHKQELSECDADNAEMRTEIGVLREHAEKLNKTVCDLQHRFSLVQSGEAIHKKAMEEKTAEVNRLESVLQELQDHISRLQADKELVDQQVCQLDGVNQGLNERHVVLTLDHDAVQTELQRTKESAEVLAREVSKMQAEMTDIEEKLREEIMHERKEVEKLLAQRDSLTDELSKVKATMKSYRDGILSQNTFPVSLQETSLPQAPSSSITPAISAITVPQDNLPQSSERATSPAKRKLERNDTTPSITTAKRAKPAGMNILKE